MAWRFCLPHQRALCYTQPNPLHNMESLDISFDKPQKIEDNNKAIYGGLYWSSLQRAQTRNAGHPCAALGATKHVGLETVTLLMMISQH